jgi:hypothetical protein
MPREIRQLPLFPPAPPTPEEDAAIAALESLKALAEAPPRVPPCHCCQAPGCTVPISLSLLMCPDHWRRVPKPLQTQVWRHYRNGQEEDKNPSPEYLVAAQAAIKSLVSPAPESQEQAPAPQPVAFHPRSLPGDSERAEVIVDRTYEHCPDDPEILVVLACGHTERVRPSGLSDDGYVALAEALKAQDASKPPPGARD